MGEHDEHALTRRSFVVGGVASAVVLGVGFEAPSGAGAAKSDLDFVFGRFIDARGERSAVVSVGGRSIPVTLTPGAFITHGTDGVVDSVAAYVPGENVVVRGTAFERAIVGVELQSVYTSVTGTIVIDGGSQLLFTPSGMQVRVPEAVARRDFPSGLRNGSTYFATIWTDPSTGEVTAVDLSSEKA
jgi:hypothetical protein